MPYTATRIPGLVITDPTGAERKSLGDDAIREIKAALKGSFPNLGSGQYTGTADQLNNVVASSIPVNAIIMYSGDTANIPTGWTLCDGRLRNGGTGAASPNLVGKFIMAAQATSGGSGLFPYPDTTGGNNEIVAKDVLGSNNLVNYATANTILTVANLPPLTNSIQVQAALGGGGDNHTSSSTVSAGLVNASSTSWETAPMRSIGLNGTGHSHSFQIDTSKGGTVVTAANIPQYYALAFIIKD